MKREIKKTSKVIFSAKSQAEKQDALLSVFCKLNKEKKEELAGLLSKHYGIKVELTNLEEYTLNHCTIKKPLTIVSIQSLPFVQPRPVNVLVRLIRNSKSVTEWGLLAFELLQSCHINDPSNEPIYKGWVKAHAPKG